MLQEKDEDSAYVRGIIHWFRGLSSENRVPPAVMYSIKKALGSWKTLCEY